MTSDNKLSGGLVTLTNGSNAVTGSGTAFQTGSGRKGDILKIRSTGEWAFVNTITSDEALTIDNPWPHTTIEDAEYDLYLFESATRSVENSTMLRQFLEELGDDYRVKTLSLSQAEYDALTTDAQTLYLVP